jgi:hypothetical protein
MSATRITPEIKKSTKLVITELAGIIRRGKYIFEIRLALPIRELLVSDKALAKNCHGRTAEKTRIGYGTPSEGNFASFPKTIVNTTIVKKGRITAHAMPMTVCL